MSAAVSAPSRRDLVAGSTPRNRPSSLVRVVLAVGSGLLLVAAFPPYGLWWLAPVSVAGLTLACRGARLRSSTVVALLFGLAFFVPLLRWSGTFVGPVPWLMLALLQSVMLAPLGPLTALVQRLPAWPPAVAAAWVAAEALRSRAPFGGFPWGRLAFAQGRTSFTGWAAWGGAPLLTFAVALCGALLAAGVVHRAGRTPAPARSRTARLRGSRAAPLALAVAVGASGLAVAAVPDGTSVRREAVVALVQGNVPRLGLAAGAQARQVLANHLDATTELAARVRSGELPAPEVVLWPENATDLDPLTDPEVAAALQRVTDDVGVPVLVGAVLDGPGRFISNAGVLWRPGSGAGQVYVKRHPVPFGEYIPLRSLARRISDKVDLVARDFAAGETPGVIPAGDVVLGDVICFEVAYDSIVRDVVTGGAEIVVVQTNNATFGRSGESAQQLEMSRVRAVETGRSVLVVATSGISAVVARDGRLVAEAGIFTRDLLVEPVPLVQGQTVATRVGTLPEWLLTGLALIVGLLALRRRSLR